MEKSIIGDNFSVLKSTSVFIISAHILSPIGPSIASTVRGVNDRSNLPYTVPFPEFNSSTYKISQSDLNKNKAAETFVNFVENFKHNAETLDPEISGILNKHFLDMF